MTKFSINQRVKQYDEDEYFWAKGTIVEVEENFIKIKWDDIAKPCKHDEDEFDSIFILS